MELGEVIKLIRQKRGLTQNQLVECVDSYDTTNLSRFERGDQGIAHNKLMQIAKRLDIKVSTIFAILETDGKLLINRPEVLKDKNIVSFDARDKWGYDKINPTAAVRSVVPLITATQAGRWAIIRESVLEENTIEWIETTSNLSDRAFAMKVEGDSMSNPYSTISIAEGSIIVVDPEVHIYNGAIVVFRRKGEDEANIKQIKYDGGTQYLKPLNPQYPIIKLDENCIMIGKCIEVIFKLP